MENPGSLYGEPWLTVWRTLALYGEPWLTVWRTLYHCMENPDSLYGEPWLTVWRTLAHCMEREEALPLSSSCYQASHQLAIKFVMYKKGINKGDLVFNYLK
jgi:hypothetical protein